jgi:putative tricarboxylic transport membrane protein
MKKADLITGVILLIISGYVIAESLQMRSPESFGPGAGFVPFWLGMSLAVLAVILMVNARRYHEGMADRSPFPAKKELFSVVLAMAGLAGYIIFMEWLGFIVNTILFVAFLMKAVERERWTMALKVAVLATASLYIVFHTLLTIELPKNMFGF